jgi:high-affinity Fe2+/Pb2+ permease
MSHPLYTGWALIALGVVLLVFIIPFFGSRIAGNSKTDFFSMKAAYWCILSGVFLIILQAVQSLSCQVIEALRK